jgi:hypothetical protein
MMKKVMLFAGAFVMLGLVSCKKEHTCSCDFTIDGKTTTVEATSEKMKKSDAETLCTENNGTAAQSGVETKTECSLK